MRVLMVLPRRDFDPTETAVPWWALRRVGHEVAFATPDGNVAVADPRMVTGAGLGPWKGLLMAAPDALEDFVRITGDAGFRAPMAYGAMADYGADALVLPGGHAPGMREYLEATAVQSLVVAMMDAGRPVGAICHGTVVMARSVRPATGRSVLHGLKTTSLLRSQELSAWALTAAWLGSYYRTYPETVQAEVTRALAKPEDFVAGPMPVSRDREDDLDPGFVVEDGAYVSARWPGDAHRFAQSMLKQLAGRR